jgi:hypothetical protein
MDLCDLVHADAELGLLASCDDFLVMSRTDARIDPDRDASTRIELAIEIKLGQ